MEDKRRVGAEKARRSKGTSMEGPHGRKGVTLIGQVWRDLMGEKVLD